MTKWACWDLDAAGALFCLAISLLGFFFAVRPLLKQQTAYAKQKDQLAFHRREVSQLSASDLAHRKEFASIRRSLTESKVKLQSINRVNRRIAELTELVKDCGLRTDNIQLGKVTRGPKYDVVPITMAGHGGYKNFATFLHKCSQAVPDMGVASFEMSGDPQAPQSDQSFRFEVLWYAAPTGNPS